MFDINIYIETTIKGPRVSDGSYGYIVEYNSKKLYTRDGIGAEKQVTANQLALTACIKAISILKSPCDITIHTDSNYLVNQFPRLAAWKANKWLNSSGKEIKNKDLWQELERLTNNHKMELAFSKSHAYSNWLQTKMRKERNAI